jgi:hypothetical protein
MMPVQSTSPYPFDRIFHLLLISIVAFPVAVVALAILYADTMTRFGPRLRLTAAPPAAWATFVNADHWR